MAYACMRFKILPVPLSGNGYPALSRAGEGEGGEEEEWDPTIYTAVKVGSVSHDSSVG